MERGLHYLYEKKNIKNRHLLYPYTKINSRLIKTLNVKENTSNFLRNIRAIFMTFGRQGLKI